MLANLARKPASVGRALRMKSRKPLRLLRNPFRYIYQRTNLPLRGFTPKFTVFQATDSFILKTADTPFEFRQALKLRHDIFYKEMQNKEAANLLDMDAFDMLCDHLIIIDKKTSKVVGTYRLISSVYSDKFYSAGEFAIGQFLALSGNKLELGRACIDKEYRNGAILKLLWRGIVEYTKKTDAKYLFGCASVQTTDPILASQILAYLRAEGLFVEDLGIHPTAKYQSSLPAAEVGPETAAQIPALIQSYMKAGAKFYGVPAIDKDFGCYDFFMVLKMDELNKLFRRRFGLDT